MFNRGQVEKNQEKKVKQKIHFDRGTRALGGLEKGSSVMVQPLVRAGTWSPGTCIGEAGPRSYKVQLNDGTEIRRNRRHLRETKTLEGQHPENLRSEQASSSGISQRKRKSIDTTVRDTPRRSARLKKPKVIFTPE